jgi:hypothetical protein
MQLPRAGDSMKTCPMCGYEGDFPTYGKWYQYDNGERFIAHVCGKCVWQHNILTKEGK